LETRNNKRAVGCRRVLYYYGECTLIRHACAYAPACAFAYQDTSYLYLENLGTCLVTHWFSFYIKSCLYK